MHSIKLHYPINNLDGKLLLPAGSELNDDTIREEETNFSCGYVTIHTVVNGIIQLITSIDSSEAVY